MLLDGKEKSIKKTFEILDKFYSVSGLNANIDKTQAVWLGKKAKYKELCPELDIKWVDEFILLVIKFSRDIDKIVELNYNPKIDSLKSVLREYCKRRLSLIGEVTVVKSLAIPKFVHLMTALPNPGAKLINEINK